MFRKLFATAAFGVALTGAGAALANPPPADNTQLSTNCASTNITPNASFSCVGWFYGNINGGSPADNGYTANDLNALLGTHYTASTFPVLETLGNLNGNTIDFTHPLYGLTVFSVHVGAAVGAGGVGSPATAFYEFNAGNLPGGLDTITFNVPGLSNAVLFSTGRPGVPEPATWALMLAGFFGAGAMLRRARQLALA